MGFYLVFIGETASFVRVQLQFIYFKYSFLTQLMTYYILLLVGPLADILNGKREGNSSSSLTALNTLKCCG